MIFKNVFNKTLGCQVNEHDSGKVLGVLNAMQGCALTAIGSLLALAQA